MQWNLTNFALWGDKLDDAELPHIISNYDEAGQRFWEEFPHCSRVVITLDVEDTSKATASIWLDHPVDEDEWVAEAAHLAWEPRRSVGVASRKPDLKLGGDGPPPPQAMWLQHPAIERVTLYYFPGVEAIKGLWHVMGGSDMWECDVWLTDA